MENHGTFATEQAQLGFLPRTTKLHTYTTSLSQLYLVMVSLWFTDAILLVNISLNIKETVKFNGHKTYSI